MREERKREWQLWFCHIKTSNIKRNFPSVQGQTIKDNEKTKNLRRFTCFWFCPRWVNNNMHCNNGFLKLTKGHLTLANSLTVLQNLTRVYDFDITCTLRSNLLIWNKHETNFLKWDITFKKKKRDITKHKIIELEA